MWTSVQLPVRTTGSAVRRLAHSQPPTLAARRCVDSQVLSRSSKPHEAATRSWTTEEDPRLQLPYVAVANRPGRRLSASRTDASQAQRPAALEGLLVDVDDGVAVGELVGWRVGAAVGALVTGAPGRAWPGVASLPAHLSSVIFCHATA